MQTRSGRQIKKPDFYKPPETFDDEEDEEEEEEEDEEEEEEEDEEDADENGNLKDFIVYSDDEDN